MMLMLFECTYPHFIPRDFEAQRALATCDTGQQEVSFRWGIVFAANMP